jgi:hypothetical protein
MGKRFGFQKPLSLMDVKHEKLQFLQQHQGSLTKE